MTDCEHYNDGCNLGLFGGKPLAGNCRACMASGENNQEYATALFASRETTHPQSVRKISGCCDPPPKEPV